MQRGEVWWVSFDPSLGGEIQKTRPAVIISNNVSNAALNRLQVIPLTSNTGKLYPCEALVMVNAVPSKAMADQLTTVSKQRLKKRLCLLSTSDMESIESIIRLQLGLQRIPGR
jgi:mRNA interferase MazF